MKDLKKIITEDYVSYETVKLLKEKGFDEQVISFYPPSDIQRPTLQMVRKWLKIVHKIGIFPSTYTFSNVDGSGEYHPYGCAIIDLKTHELLTNDIFPKETEEETVEEAIKFCLKKLI